jgi:DNA-binding transcriptional regulator YiaG
LDIPVADVAIHMGVSRQTVYNWFSGVHDPQGLYVEAAEKFLIKLTNRK